MKASKQRHSPSPASFAWLLYFSPFALCTQPEERTEASWNDAILAYFHRRDVYRHKVRAWRCFESLIVLLLPNINCVSIQPQQHPKFISSQDRFTLEPLSYFGWKRPYKIIESNHYRTLPCLC